MLTQQDFVDLIQMQSDTYMICVKHYAEPHP